MDTGGAFDLAVIGAGPGGYVAAIRAAQLGMKVALIEQESRLGGTCLNVGCIPSKALLESSELFQRSANGLQEHGIVAARTELDLGRMMARKDQVVRQLTEGIALLMKKNRVKVVNGRGALAGEGRVGVVRNGQAQEIRAKHIVLAAGSLPAEIPSLPFDGHYVLSSTETLSLNKVPDHLVVVGAGAVGLELGSVWRRLGAKVTVVEMLPHVVPFADRQVAKALERSLIRQGLELRLGCQVQGAEVREDRLHLTVAGRDEQPEALECDKVLVAVGRRPATQRLGLQESRVRLDRTGRIEVDGAFRTGVPGVYAIGDLIRGPMLAHKAEEEGIAVAETLSGRSGHVNYETIPSIVYTAPELAQVGLTEEEAKAQGLPCRTGRCYFKANGRARCLGEDEGMVKLVSHAETDRLLGVHIVGPRASELIAEAVLALEFHASSEDLARTTHAHPTLSEALKEAALAVDRRSIHG
ncbi:MAG: dihydrolipoyl dehydrogenase [bacterium]